jgi:hypothetical protein
MASASSAKGIRPEKPAAQYPYLHGKKGRNYNLQLC